LPGGNDLSLTINFMTRCDMGNVATYSYKKNNLHEESREKFVKIWHGSDSRKMCLSICDDTKFSPFEH